MTPNKSLWAYLVLLVLFSFGLSTTVDDYPTLHAAIAGVGFGVAYLLGLATK